MVKTMLLAWAAPVERAILGVLVVLMCLAPMRAQVSTADILGTVTDSSGAVLVGAKITVENPETGLTRTATSDSSGNYAIALLPTGRYNIKVEQAGFRVATITSVALAIGDRARQDIRLEVGQATESVQVSAQASALQSDSAAVGNLITDRVVQDTPLNGRNFIRLAQLGAGTNESTPNAMSSGNRPDDRRRTSALSVNGQRDYANSYLIDGIDDNERYIGTIMVKPSEDALQEFRVQTNSYAAEVGRTAGGVANLITKSGTNTIHGSLFEFFRNEHLDAKNYFVAATAPNPPYKLNQFGGSVGGPIKKDRTFFFGDYEGLRLRQGITYASTVPTLAMHNGNFAGLSTIYDPLSGTTSATRTPFAGNIIPVGRRDPTGLALLNLYPLPTIGGLTNNFTFSPVKAQRDDTFDTKIDHMFDERNQFFARYSFNDTNSYKPGQLPAVDGIFAGGDAGQYAGVARQRAQQGVASFIHTFTPALLLDLKAAYSRYVVRTTPVNYLSDVNSKIGIPGTNIDDDSSGLSPIGVAGYVGMGDATSIPLATINNVFQYQGSLTYIRGSHQMKMGGDLRRRQLTPFQSTSSKGQFLFDTGYTNNSSVSGSGNSVASLLLGYPTTENRTKLLVYQGFRSWEFAGYFQDDWRATHWLTLNLGVRWEVFTPFTEVANRAANLPDLSTGKIVIAGQNGVGATAGVETNWHSFAPRFGFAATVTPKTVLRGGFGISFWPPNTGTGSNSVFRDPPFTSVLSLTNSGRLISQGLPVPVATDPNNPTGTIYSVAHNITNPYVQQFNLTLQRQLFGGLVFNVGYVGALSRHVVFNYNGNLAPPGPGTIQPRRPYYSLLPNVSVIQVVNSTGNQEYHSMQTGLEHRFSKGFSLSTNYTWSHNIDDNPATGGGTLFATYFPQLVTNFKNERGDSDIDIRQRFNIIASYRLPFGSRLTGLSGVLAKGWQFNAVATAQTGNVETIQTSSNLANTGQTADRPNATGIPYGGGIYGNGTSSINNFFNKAAFATNAAFTIGNLGRNTVRGPRTANVDFSAFKEFQPRERVTLQFRAEMFNILNHPNLGMPNNVLGTGAFGVIGTTGNYLARNIQFALKLLF
ncbi:MAG: TonB-dependent receptor [Acidobacteriota bacterium]